MIAHLRRFRRHALDRGATAVEYGLLVAAIAAVIVGIVFGLGNLVQGAFSKTSDCLKSSSSTAPC